MKHIAAAVAVILGFASLAAPSTSGAQTLTAKEQLIKHPEWSRIPSGPVFTAAFPQGAAERGLAGAAAIQCRVGADGALKECKVLSEKPDNAGFGAAAMRISRHFRMKPADAEGRPTAGRLVDLPIRFRIDGKSSPRLILYPGDAAIFVTPLSGEAPRDRRVFSCPSKANAERRCRAHAFDWKERPKPSAAYEILRKSSQAEGKTLLECSAGTDGALTACRVGGVATDSSEAAILEWAKLLRAPAKASDGAALADGRIVVEIDWADVNPTPGAS